MKSKWSFVSSMNGLLCRYQGQVKAVVRQNKAGLHEFATVAPTGAVGRDGYIRFPTEPEGAPRSALYFHNLGLMLSQALKLEA